MEKLNKHELGELLGGDACNPNSSVPIDPKRNTNTVQNCYCTWLDTGVIVNNNKIVGCKCICNYVPII